ncbi:MAG: helix-turn-helix transcriptional regulator [Acidobacteria bacterium]|nr:helix-turn-helix transcriptional regulator [Acidobacteriota bacterium]
MSGEDAFDRIVTSLHAAMLDDSHWPATSALIDEACGVAGQSLMVGEGGLDERKANYVGIYHRGRRREELEREYLENYYPIDECVPRVRRLPDSRLVHVRELYTADELKTSPAYNELFPRARQRNSLAVRLVLSDGAHVFWALGDPVVRNDWGFWQIRLMERLMPQVRQFVRVRQVLVRAAARQATLTGLLDNRRLGVIHLDRRARILEANDRARSILRSGDGLSDEKGELRVQKPNDPLRFARLVAGALPSPGAAPVSGSMPLRRASVAWPLAVHVHPVAAPQPDYGTKAVAVQVLIVDPRGRRRVDPGLVATALGLTRAESRIAVSLAEGKSVRQIATTTGRTKNAIYWHLKQIYRRLSISGQADLLRLVLSLADLG